MTEARRDMIDLSRSPWQSRILRRFEADEYPLSKPILRLKDLLEVMPVNLRISEDELGTFLREHEPEPGDARPQRRSTTSVEEAVRSTVDEACRAVSGLRRVELDRIGAEVEGGRVVRWHVKLQAVRDPED